MEWLRSTYWSLIYGIQNLCIYFRVIWRDRQYHHGYTEQLLLTKYRRVYKHMDEDAVLRSVDHEEYMQALRICITILERRIEGEYSDFYTDLWDLREGRRLEMYFEEIDRKDTNGEKLYEMKSKVVTPLSFPRNHWLKLTQEIEKRDWALFCKLMQKYHNHWWT